MNNKRKIIKLDNINSSDQSESEINNEENIQKKIKQDNKV